MSLTEKNSYWEKIVRDIERKAHLETLDERIKNYDFSLTLPNKLRERVAKIIDYEFDEYDRNVFIAEPEVEAPISYDDLLEEETKKLKKPEDFNESTCSEIERMENEFGGFHLLLEKPLEHKRRSKKKRNWFSTYVCKPRKERVQWDSKAYNMEQKLRDKTLDEQAEELMDASAERFTDWLNSLSSTSSEYMTKDKLKALFSIEGDRRLLSSILTEPKEVKAIAKTVADKWNLPEMAIELKYENYIADRLKKAPKVINKVAFGRTIPSKDLPWRPSKTDVLIQPIFPTELLSFEKLFKGITHLRSTRALIDFYKNRPALQRPQYLVDTGCFLDKETEAAKGEIPLYELLNLKY